MVKKSMRIAGDGQWWTADGQLSITAHQWPSKCPFIPFFTTNAFWPDLSKIFSRRMHISCDFVYFPHISDLFWIILGKFHSIFLILCDGKEKHENSRWWAVMVSGPKCPFIPFFFQPVLFCLIWASFLAEECIFQVILSIFHTFQNCFG